MMRTVPSRPFEYTPSFLTDIRVTFRRFGFRPTSDVERTARQPEAGLTSDVADPRALGTVGPVVRLVAKRHGS